MLQKLLYLAAFILGWMLATVITPPAFIQTRVDAFFSRGEKYVKKKQTEVKNSLRETVRKGAKKIEKKLEE